MSKESNPTLIGAFVVGAIALLAIGAAVFGGGELLKNKNTFVTYFDDSVKGLRVGSNVAFRGVRIGAVTDLSLIADLDTLDVTIRVEFETEGDAFHSVAGGKLIETVDAIELVTHQDLIDSGLRAKLVS
ncbi:MAG: MlaD family protein, partial [Gammaproteobacteria bacterium]